MLAKAGESDRAIRVKMVCAYPHIFVTPLTGFFFSPDISTVHAFFYLAF
jgi:hypothetical protein